ALEPYTTYGPRARVGFLTPVKTERVQLGVGWQIERLSFRDVSPLLEQETVDGGPTLDVALGLDRPQRVGAYTGLLTVDLRDHPIEPTLGAYAGLRSAIGTRLAGGAFEFVQLVPELRGYVPLGPVVLGARVRAGTFLGDVPATERFFAGGASSHRGFGERRLAPTRVGDVMGDEHIVPYGGESMLESSVEARFPIATWREIGIGGVLFLDGGDVREELADVALRELHWAAGVGLRFRTLVGPIRADLGYRLNRFDRMPGSDAPASGSRFAFHLSLGEAF
ncbi:MAG TPA: BamA/TamA family outer membrane protein, partial [Kofleriaceae bacterium]|nr:BamA/TamA family outer membrane protein [Kofleriaceae bacterium]